MSSLSNKPNDDCPSDDSSEYDSADEEGLPAEQGEQDLVDIGNTPQNGSVMGSRKDSRKATGSSPLSEQPKKSTEESQETSATTPPSDTGDASPASSSTPAVQPRKKYRKDFEWGDVLGSGSYGEVQRAVDKETGIEHAVKILNKKQIVAQKKVEWVTREKKLLDTLRHPNIVRLYFTFSDPDSLHFVLELCPNGELLDVVKKLGHLNQECTRFYAAQLLTALEYCHAQGAVHRDIKPENILLDKDNQSKLIDFGTAKSIGTTALARTNSFVGTAEYVSPELLSEKEAGLSADLWAFGCVIYQFTCGRPPFKAVNDYLIFKKVRNRDFTYPPNFPEVTKSLVEQLLSIEPAKRLGNEDENDVTYDTLKKHPFFEGINWDTVSTQTPPPLVVPDVLIVFPDDVEKMERKKQEAEALRVVEERKRKLEEQLSSKWSKFVEGDELIIKTGMTEKNRKMSCHKRMLILTDKPRLIYVDPKKMVVKGHVPWSEKMQVQKLDESHFTIMVPGRTFKWNDLSKSAQSWVEEINGVNKSLKH